MLTFKRKAWKAGATWIAVSLLHGVASIALLFVVIGQSSRRLDQGTYPSIFESLLNWVLQALMFPLVEPGSRLLAGVQYGLLGYLLWAANSLLWGAAICYGLRWLYRRWQRQ